VASPLAIGFLAAFSQTIKPTAFTPPRDWPSAGIGSSARPIKTGPSRFTGEFSRRWRLRHCCPQRPRFRGLIPLPVETPLADDFSAWRRPGSLGLSLPGAFPFPSLGRNNSLRCHVWRTQRAARSAPEPFGTRPRSPQSPLLSGTLGTHPNWVMLPVLQSVKELGSWLTSSEVAGPLRFPSSSWAHTQVSDRECRQAGILNLGPEWLLSSRIRHFRRRERTTAISMVRNRCQSALVQGIYGLNKHRRGRSAGGAGVSS
jgi:hypothetical protein